MLIQYLYKHIFVVLYSELSLDWLYVISVPQHHLHQTAVTFKKIHSFIIYPPNAYSLQVLVPPTPLISAPYFYWILLMYK